MPPCCWPATSSGLRIATAVVDRDVADVLDAAGLDVDLDDRDVRAERERRVALVEVERVGERGLHPGGQLRRVLRRDRELGPAQRRRGNAGDAETRALLHHDVVDVRLEQVRGERLRLRQHLLARAVQRAAADLQRARAHRAGAARARARCRTGRASPSPSGCRAAPARSSRTRSRGPARAPTCRPSRSTRAVVVDLDRAELLEQAAGGDLDVGRHADAELHRVAALATCRLLGAQLVVAGDAARLVERLRVLADVVVRAGDASSSGNASGGMKFRLRISTGSMPSSSAAMSMMRSSICVASGRPAPRYAAVGVVFVAALQALSSTLGIAYTPCAIVRVRNGEERADRRVRAGVRQHLRPSRR